MKKYIAVMLMLVLLAMPGTQGLLAQDYSENSLQNELTLPQIEASQEQAADELGELPDEQEQCTGEQEEAPDGQEIPYEQKGHPDNSRSPR